MEKARKINRIRIFIFFILLTGVAAYFVVEKITKEMQRSYVNLYFTDYTNTKLLLEKRIFVYNADKVKNIKEALRELSYGPLSNYLEPVLSHNAEVIDVWYSDKFLYLNFNSDAFKKVTNSELSIKSINTTIFNNFPFVNNIQYLIDGNRVPTVTGFEDLSVVYRRGR